MVVVVVVGGGGGGGGGRSRLPGVEIIGLFLVL